MPIQFSQVIPCIRKKGSYITKGYDASMKRTIKDRGGKQNNAVNFGSIVSVRGSVVDIWFE